jgi:hypothetical protein
MTKKEEKRGSNFSSFVSIIMCEGDLEVLVCMSYATSIGGIILVDIYIR